MNRDMAFISRRFDTVELPREKAYLYKYFKTDVQEAFLKYVHVFGDYENFTDHTGRSCSPRWLKRLYDRLVHLETFHRECKAGRTERHMRLLALVESGRYRPGRADCLKFPEEDGEQEGGAVGLQPSQDEVE